MVPNKPLITPVPRSIPFFVLCEGCGNGWHGWPAMVRALHCNVLAVRWWAGGQLVHSLVGVGGVVAWVVGKGICEAKESEHARWRVIAM